MFTTIRSRAGCCITTMSTLTLDMLTGRSSLAGTRLVGRMGGRLCKPNVPRRVDKTNQVGRRQFATSSMISSKQKWWRQQVQQWCDGSSCKPCHQPRSCYPPTHPPWLCLALSLVLSLDRCILNVRPKRGRAYVIAKERRKLTFCPILSHPLPSPHLASHHHADVQFTPTERRTEKRPYIRHQRDFDQRLSGHFQQSNKIGT